MRYMGSVNRVCRLLLPIVLLCYFVYLFVDSTANRNSIYKTTIDAHRKNLSIGGKQIEGLILGGSNASFGLSAEVLTQRTSANFYNLALSGEGFNDAAYNQFIVDTTKDYIDHRNIQLVVYSSILPMRSASLYRYVTERRVNSDGIRLNTIKPHVPIASFIKRSREVDQGPKIPPRIPLLNGDLNFRTTTCLKHLDETRFDLAPAKAVFNFLKQKNQFLRRIFPKAKIILVIPSEYYAGGHLPTDWIKEITDNFERIKSDQDFLHVESPIPSIEYLCDANHHPNEKGRVWRTANFTHFLDQVAGMRLN